MPYFPVSDPIGRTLSLYIDKLVGHNLLTFFKTFIANILPLSAPEIFRTWKT